MFEPGPPSATRKETFSGSGGEAPYIQAFIHSFFKKFYYLFIWLCEVFLFFIYFFGEVFLKSLFIYFWLY